MVDKYITPAGGKFGDDKLQTANAQALAKLEQVFPTISKDKWKELLRARGVDTGWYSYISPINDEEDNLFENA